MKSKAQQFVEYLQPKTTVIYRPAIRVNVNENAYMFVVNDGGDCQINNTSIVFSPQDALALRDWLTDTFDTPKVPKKQSVVHDEDWFGP